MSRYKKDNSGGFGNPPEKNQFVKGGPGGPGRPKGSKTIEGALRKVFSGKVPYLENGNRKEGLAVEALAKRALQHGLSGSARANEAALNLAAKYGPEELAQETHNFDLSLLTIEDKRTLLRLICLANGEQPPEELVDPLNTPSTMYESTVDGIFREHVSVGANRTTRLLSVGSKAYISASLPRERAVVSRLRRSIKQGGDHEYL